MCDIMHFILGKALSSACGWVSRTYFDVNYRAKILNKLPEKHRNGNMYLRQRESFNIGEPIRDNNAHNPWIMIG